MKRIDKKLWQSAPKCLSNIFKSEPVSLNITLRAKMEDVFFPVLVYYTSVNAIRTEIVVAIWAIPFCCPGGMEVTDRFYCHGKVPFLFSLMHQALVINAKKLLTTFIDMH